MGYYDDDYNEYNGEMMKKKISSFGSCKDTHQKNRANIVYAEEFSDIRAELETYNIIGNAGFDPGDFED